jgi:hypothetical protein
VLVVGRHRHEKRRPDPNRDDQQEVALRALDDTGILEVDAAEQGHHHAGAGLAADGDDHRQRDGENRDGAQEYRLVVGDDVDDRELGHESRRQHPPGRPPALRMNQVAGGLDGHQRLTLHPRHRRARPFFVDLLRANAVSGLMPPQ